MVSQPHHNSLQGFVQNPFQLPNPSPGQFPPEETQVTTMRSSGGAEAYASAASPAAPSAPSSSSPSPKESPARSVQSAPDTSLPSEPSSPKPASSDPISSEPVSSNVGTTPSSPPVAGRPSPDSTSPDSTSMPEPISASHASLPSASSPQANSAPTPSAAEAVAQALSSDQPVDFFANFKRPAGYGGNLNAGHSSAAGASQSFAFGQSSAAPRSPSTHVAAESQTPAAKVPTHPSADAHVASAADVSPQDSLPSGNAPFPPANLIPFPNSALRQSQQDQAEFVIPLRNDEYLPAISRWTTWGGLVLLSALGATTGLAAITPSPVLVRSSAVVRPQGELKVVQAIAEGTIESIKVKEGETINRGQAIAVLDDSRLQTRQRQLEVGLQQRQMQIQQLQAQMVTLETQRIAEQNLTDRAIASARAELLRVERDHADRKAVAQKDVQESEALMAAALAEYQSYQQAAEIGVLPRVQAETKQRSYEAAKARVERARTALDPSTASITMAQESIAQTQAQGSSTQANIQRQRESLLQQQSQIRQQIEQDKQELIQLEQEFDKMVIRAQTDGELMTLNLRNEGQVVRSGEVIAQVFPKDAPLTIKAKVLPQDIGQVTVGQRVSMRVSAYSYADYGTLEGTVTAVGSDAVSSQSQSGAPAPSAGSPSYFEVTIQPEQDFLLKGEQEFEISPGMEVQADIVAKEETVLTMVLRKARILTGL